MTLPPLTPPIKPSSNVAGLHYNPDTKELSVQFQRSARRYVYPETTLEEYNAIMYADSAGKAFNSFKAAHPQFRTIDPQAEVGL